MVRHATQPTSTPLRSHTPLPSRRHSQARVCRALQRQQRRQRRGTTDGSGTQIQLFLLSIDSVSRHGSCAVLLGGCMQLEDDHATRGQAADFQATLSTTTISGVECETPHQHHSSARNSSSSKTYSAKASTLPSFHPSIHPSIRPSVHPSIHHPPIHRSTHPSLRMHLLAVPFPVRCLAAHSAWRCGV